MTVCSGGSTTKPGTNTSLYIDGNFVKSLLPAGWEWLYDYLPYMRPLAIGDVSAFCSVDPPTWTLPSAIDFYNFITGGYVTQNDAVSGFINNLTRMYLWYSICQCVTGSATPPATPPAAPTGLPGVNPGTVVTSPATACAHFDSLVSDQSVTATSGGNYMIPQATFAVLNTDALYPLPSGATTIVLKVTDIVAGTHHGNTGYTYGFWTPSKVFISNVVVNNMVSGTTRTTTIGVPTTAGYFQIYSSLGGPSFSNDNMKATIDVYCGSTATQQETPCCPPDPIATGLLRQILDMVTLVQRQVAPFAYVTGTVHTGLTGDQLVSVADLVGARVVVTSFGAGVVGQGAGAPPPLYDVGWISWGTSDGFVHRERIGSTDFLSFPAAAGLYTTIGLSLNATVEVSLSELIREP